MIYSRDSFFTLTGAGQAGLAVLSLILCALMIALSYRITRRWFRSRSAIWPPMIAVVLFWLFLWLSPQLYYTYYRLIIDGLPNQLVIQQPPSLRAVFEILLLQAKPALAQHGQAVMGWLMIAASLICQRRR